MCRSGRSVPKTTPPAKMPTAIFETMNVMMRDDRQHVAARHREAPLEELRHREDERAHVERHEHPGEHEQTPGVQLVVRQRHAVLGARAGQADDVLGADVGGENRGADDPPAQIATGQEVVGGGVLVLAEIPTRSDNPDPAKYRKMMSQSSVVIVRRRRLLKGATGPPAGRTSPAGASGVYSIFRGCNRFPPCDLPVRWANDSRRAAVHRNGSPVRSENLLRRRNCGRVRRAESAPPVREFD